MVELVDMHGKSFWVNTNCIQVVCVKVEVLLELMMISGELFILEYSTAQEAHSALLSLV